MQKAKIIEKDSPFYGDYKSYSDGTQEYFIGLDQNSASLIIRHRLDGPAIVFSKDNEYEDEWWFLGTEITCSSQEEFEKIVLQTYGINIQQEIKNMNKDTTMGRDTTDAPKKTFFNTVKDDLHNGAYLASANQASKAMKEGILKAMKVNGSDSGYLKMVSDFLETELGNAFVSYSLGHVLPNVPMMGQDPRVVRLAENMRTQGVASGMNMVIALAMQFVVPGLMGALQALPPAASALENVKEINAPKKSKRKVRVSPVKKVEVQLEDPDEEEEAPRKIRAVK